MKTDNANPNDSGDHPIAIDHLSPDDHSCQMMMEKAPLAIFVLDGEGNFIEANDATCHLSGYSKAELISMSTVDVVGAETHTTALDDLSKLRKTGRVTTEFRLKRKDGSVIWALLEAVALSEDRFMGLCSNITERKQIEESLRQSEERYRGIFNESVAAIYHFDSQKRFIDSNQAGLDLLGYSRGDLLQMKISDVDADPKVVLPKHKILLSGDNLVNYEHQLKRKDGEIISVLNNSKPLTDELGNVIGMQSTLLNVTDRKRAQEQLRNSEARLTEAQHIANIGHWELDLITDHLTLSDEVYRILGVDPQHFIVTTRALLDAVHPDDRVHVNETYTNSLKRRIPFDIVHRLQMKDGKEKIVNTRCETHYDHRGKVIRSVGTIQDITEFKQTKDALAEAENRYQEMVNTLVEGIGVTDEKEILQYVNPAFVKIFGEESANEMVGKNLLDYFSGNQRKLIVSETGKRMKGISSRYELELITANGDKKHLYVSASPRFDDKSEYIGGNGTVLDITELKQVEEALRKGEDKYRALIETTDTGYLIFEETGRVIDANPEYVRQTGHKSLEEILGRSVMEWTAEHERERSAKEINLCIERGFTKDLEIDYVDENGVITPIEVNAKVVQTDEGVRILSLCRDITKRKKAEQALKESEVKYRTLFECSSQGILVVEVETNRILYTNSVAAGLLGCSTDQIESMRVEDICHTEDLSIALRELGSMDLGETSFIREMVCSRKDGTDLYADVSLAQTTFERERCIVAFFTDVTEIRRFREQEGRAQRLETAGKIAGQVAHDFNNLLAPLAAYPDFIRQELPAGHPVLEFIDAMDESTKRIAEINQQLLTLGRRGYYDMNPMNLNDLVRTSANDSLFMQDDINFRLILSENLMRIMAGPAQIHRLLINLIQNAIDAMEGAGEITIKTENLYVDDDAVAYSRIPRGEYVVLTVSDTGRGISDSIAQRIFDPFFTSKDTDNMRGSGLGLSVVDAVVRDHGGFIDLKTKIGSGTSFFVYFPITRDDSEDERGGSAPGGTESILVIDDDKVQRDVSQRVLQSLGYQVTVANSGVNAIELLGQGSYDLLILDMVMPPGIDGTETYRQAKELWPDQRAIVVSGFSETDRVEEAMRLGVGRFVKKPFTREAIAEAIRAELE